MANNKFFGLFLKFVCTVIVFVFISGVFKGNPDWAANICWALGFTAFFGIRDEFQPATKRLINLVMFGAAIVLSMSVALLTEHDAQTGAALAVAFLYSVYRFYEEYNLKIK